MTRFDQRTCLEAIHTLGAGPTQDYCRDSVEPSAPGVIFAIDVSYPMVKEGVVQIICDNMKQLLQSLPRDASGEKGKTAEKERGEPAKGLECQKCYT